MNNHSYPENLDEDRILKDSITTKPFRIGQVYEDKPAIPKECACGSNTFHVAQGSYFTAIRCPECLWELCIHDG